MDLVQDIRNKAIMPQIGSNILGYLEDKIDADILGDSGPCK